MGWIKWGFAFSFTWQHGRGWGLGGAPAGSRNPLPCDLFGKLGPERVGNILPAAPTEHPPARAGNRAAMGSSGSLFSWSFGGKTCREQTHDHDWGGRNLLRFLWARTGLTMS